MRKIGLTALMLGLALGAGQASAQRQLLGSDTLFEMGNEMLDLCGIPDTVLVYNGTGSSNGQNGMRDGTQQVAPMSRFINSAGCGLTGWPGVANGYAHSLDGMGIFADDNEPNDCDTLRHSGTLEVSASANGNATLECPNCVDGPDADSDLDDYVFSDWRDVLRIVYCGQHSHVSLSACSESEPSKPPPTEQACNSDVRNTLVNTWGNLFQEGAGCLGADGDNCTQLRHAFRRDDLSGTTDTFLTLLGCPNIVSSSGSQQRPFCNGTELEDEDPIRRECAGSGSGATGGENVCRRTNLARDSKPRDATGNRVATSPLQAIWGPVGPVEFPAIPGAYGPTTNQRGDLGIVLPVIIPENLDQQYANNTACPALGGAWGNVNMPAASGGGGGEGLLCPNGLRRSPGCLFPKDSAGNFGCINPASNKPPVGRVYEDPVTGLDVNMKDVMDNRVYNMTPVLGNSTVGGSIATYTRGGFDRGMVNIGFYKIHQLSALNNVPAGTGTGTGNCREPDATLQIGCFTHASPCSIGFAGLAGDGLDPNKPLLVQNPAGTGPLGPTISNVRRLLDPTGTGCGASGDFDERYPLSRKLFFNAGVGLTNVVNSPGGVLTREADYVACWGDRRMVDRAALDSGFITLTDSGCETMPISGAVPAACDLSDDNPSYEIQTCP